VNDECRTFDRWLDEGRSPSAEAPMLAHARTCARCTAALAAALEVEALLVEPLATSAPAGFTAGVMRRLAAAPRARAAIVLPEAAPLEWWLRAPADPPAAMALVLAGLLWWLRAPLWAMAAAGAAQVNGAVHALTEVSGIAHAAQLASGPLSGSTGAAALIVGLAPAMLLASWWLFGWSSRAVARSAPARVSAAPAAVAGR
jgi:hypothetical protein